MAYDFRCAECGESACYGRGVHLSKGVTGTWFCRLHVPPGFLPGSKAKVTEAPPPRPPANQNVIQGKLL